MSLHAMNRRTFLETATTVTAATLFTSRLGWAAADHKIDKVGVQLYTVRDLMKDDFDGTIAKVAQIGYKEVEFAGYFGRTGAQVRAVLRQEWPRPRSPPTCNTTNSTTSFPSVIETSKTIGLKYIVCPLIPEELRKSPDIWKQAAEKFNRCGEASQEGRHAVRLSQSLVRISSRRRQASLRRAAQGVRRQSGEDGNGLVLDHRRRRRSAEVFRPVSRTLPAGSRQGSQDASQRSPPAARRTTATPST